MQVCFSQFLMIPMQLPASCYLFASCEDSILKRLAMNAPKWGLDQDVKPSKAVAEQPNLLSTRISVMARRGAMYLNSFCAGRHEAEHFPAKVICLRP